MVKLSDNTITINMPRVRPRDVRRWSSSDWFEMPLVVSASEISFKLRESPHGKIDCLHIGHSADLLISHGSMHVL